MHTGRKKPHFFAHLRKIAASVHASGAFWRAHRMEGLAEAAARAAEEADTDAAQQPAQAAPDNSISGKKRGRGTKVESAEKKLLDLISRRAIAAAKVEQLKGLEFRKKRDDDALKSATNRANTVLSPARPGYPTST